MGGCQGHLPVETSNWRSNFSFLLFSGPAADKKMAQYLCRGLKSKVSPGSTFIRRVIAGISQNECPALGRPDHWVPVATLIPTHGEKFPYPEPWDYKKKPYTFWSQFTDRTRKRFNPNTKMIVVEGGPAVGKNEFAKRLAKNFDMLFVP